MLTMTRTYHKADDWIDLSRGGKLQRKVRPRLREGFCRGGSELARIISLRHEYERPTIIAASVSIVAIHPLVSLVTQQEDKKAMIIGATQVSRT